MSQIVLLAGLCKQVPAFELPLIGIDRGAVTAMRLGCELLAALGDFDSISDEDVYKRQLHYRNLQRLPIHLNSDLYHHKALGKIAAYLYEKTH